MEKIVNCCKVTIKDKQCKRQKDNKIFTLPRKYTKTDCLIKKPRGFSARSSCAPYKYCKRFFYNPDDPSKSFDVYIDKNPQDTISVKYKTLEDLKKTIRKLERLFKSNKYGHKRIWQVAMIIKVRLGVILKRFNKGKLRYKLSSKYLSFLSKRTKLNKDIRKKLTFKF